jgi:hypothetical protein
MKHSPLASAGLAALGLLALAAGTHAQVLLTYTDQATFLAETGAGSASGPLPDLGMVLTPTTVGSVTFSIAPGGDNLAIGAVGTGADPDWYPPTPGNDIALGYENLQVDTDTPVYALGFDFVQPDATMPVWGAPAVDSTFEVTLYDGASIVGSTQFSAIATDVPTFLGVWSDVAFSTVTIIDVTDTPFIDDDEYFGEFYTGATPAPPPGPTLVPYTDKAVFLGDTAATSATGPLPNLGIVGSAKLGSVNVGIAPGGDDLAIGPFGTDAEPDWCPLLPGHDMAQGYENLQLDLDAPVYALGIDFVQPDATMPPYGGTPVDSTFEVSLFLDDALLGSVQFSAIPVDEAAFLGVSCDTAFNRVTLVDITDTPFVDDDEFYGEVYTAPGPNVWNNLGYNLTGVFGDPLLFGTGPLGEGSDGFLVLVNGPSLAPALLFIALAENPVPFKGGTLVPVPPLASFLLGTSSLGEVVLGWPAWPGGLSGFSLHFQYALQDAAAINGISLSNALRADIP